MEWGHPHTLAACSVKGKKAIYINTAEFGKGNTLIFFSFLVICSPPWFMFECNTLNINKPQFMGALSWASNIFHSFQQHYLAHLSSVTCIYVFINVFSRSGDFAYKWFAIFWTSWPRSCQIILRGICSFMTQTSQLLLYVTIRKLAITFLYWISFISTCFLFKCTISNLLQKRARTGDIHQDTRKITIEN